MTSLACGEDFYFSTKSSLRRHYYHNIMTFFAGKTWHTTSCIASRLHSITAICLDFIHFVSRHSLVDVYDVALIYLPIIRWAYCHMLPYIEASQHQGSQYGFY